MADLDRLSMNLYHLLTQVFVLLDDADRRTLRRHDLSIRQFNALYHLDPDDGFSINDLSKRLICDKSNTTRLVERLKQEGLVIRQRDTEDRRFVSVRLTDAGVNLREQAVTTHQKSIKERFEVLSSEEQETLNVLLVRLRDGLQTQLNQNET
jgi:DNA-binding MarR family transcriptional regulator